MSTNDDVKAMKALTSETSTLASKMDLATKASGFLRSTLLGLAKDGVELFIDMAAESYRLNAEIQQSTLAMSGMLHTTLQFETARNSMENYSKAAAVSKKMTEELGKEAAYHIGSTQEFIGTFQTLSASLSKNGLVTTKNQLEDVGKAMTTLTVGAGYALLGGDVQKATAEMASLIAGGDPRNTTLGNAMGLGEDFVSADSSKRLDILMSKMEKLRPIIQEVENSAEGLSEKFNGVAERSLASMGKSSFETVNKEMQGIGRWLDANSERFETFNQVVDRGLNVWTEFGMGILDVGVGAVTTVVDNILDLAEDIDALPDLMLDVELETKAIVQDVKTNFESVGVFFAELFKNDKFIKNMKDDAVDFVNKARDAATNTYNEIAGNDSDKTSDQAGGTTKGRFLKTRDSVSRAITSGNYAELYQNETILKDFVAESAEFKDKIFQTSSNLYHTLVENSFSKTRDSLSGASHVARRHIDMNKSTPQMPVSDSMWGLQTSINSISDFAEGVVGAVLDGNTLSDSLAQGTKQFHQTQQDAVNQRSEFHKAQKAQQEQRRQQSDEGIRPKTSDPQNTRRKSSRSGRQSMINQVPKVRAVTADKIEQKFTGPITINQELRNSNPDRVVTAFRSDLGHKTAKIGSGLFGTYGA